MLFRSLDDLIGDPNYEGSRFVDVRIPGEVNNDSDDVNNSSGRM